jgi:hypothetical protein
LERSVLGYVRWADSSPSCGRQNMRQRMWRSDVAMHFHVVFAKFQSISILHLFNTISLTTRNLFNILFQIIAFLRLIRIVKAGWWNTKDKG